MTATEAILSLIGVLAMNYVVYRFMFIPWFDDMQHIKNMMRSGQWTKGTIIDYSEKKDADQMRQYASVVKFTAADGKEYIIESKDPKGVQGPLNVLVDVCYYESNPEDGIVKPRSVLNFRIFLISFALLVMLILSVGMAFKIFS